ARLRDQGGHRVGGSADSPEAAAPLEEGRKMNTTTVRPSVRTTGMNATLRWGLAAIAVGMILGALLAP
ncbi:MAG: hypothetical protein ACO38P_11655, partial [Phycisphaerales bacterium]